MGAQTDRIAQSWERRFGDEAVRQFENDKRHLLALLREAQHKSLAQKATVNWLTLDQEWQVYLELAGDNWREAFIPLMQGVMMDQGNALNLAFGMQFDVRNLFAEAWFNDYTIEFAQPILATTERDVRQLLQQAQAEGWSIPTMQKHLTEVFEQYMAGELTPEDFAWFEARMPAYRRELIARSETIRSSNRGSEALYRDWGVQYKEWLTALDDRTCPWCAEMNGKRIPTDGRFFEKGDVFAVGQGDAAQKLALNYENVTSPPLHPNCRCTLIPWNPAWETDATAPVAEGTETAPVQTNIPASFTSHTDADKWLHSMPGINPTFTPEEEEAMMAYKATEHVEINDDLRLAGYSESDYVDYMDALLARSKLDQPAIVYRGTDWDVFEEDDLTDSIITDKAFVSTTLTRETAERFADGALLEIRVPQGAQAINMEQWSIASGSESELLLQRGSKFRVISDNINDDPDDRLLVLEIIL